MKPSSSIAFVTANLDGGGVSDHIKALAPALDARGVTVRILSRQACRDCDLSGIDWIGLHFVSYAWAPQGLLRHRDIEALRNLGLGRRVAIYLHELWIGESAGASLKHRLIGLLQRKRLLRLIARLQPAMTFTNTAVYQAILAREHIPAEVLPLPGNLPVATADDRREAQAWLAAAGLHHESATSLAAVFGTIHPEWNPAPALASWQSHQAGEGSQAVLLALGRHGPAGAAQLAALPAAVPGLPIINAGEQPASLLAGLLAECSLGVATTPWALIGKSGTAAAFLEAGLPVLVTRDDWRWRRGPTPPPRPHPQLWRWTDPPAFPWAKCLASRTAPTLTLPAVAEVWCELLTGAGSSPP